MVIRIISPGSAIEMSYYENKNKFESNKKYFTISVYTVCVVLICTVGIRAIFNWAETAAFLSQLAGRLYPFFAGAFIAYVLNPLVKRLENSFFSGRLKLRSRKLCRFLSILTSYIVVLGLVMLFFLFIIPQLASSIYDLILAIPSVDELKGMLEILESYFPNVDWP